MAITPAAGRPTTGVSYVVVADYVAPGGIESYRNGQRLARVVNFSVNVETDKDNEFYADNVVAESESGMFSAGTLSLTVDGMNPAVSRYVQGLPEPKTVTVGGQQIEVTGTGGAANAPYVGVGIIVEHRSGGQRIYVPYIFTKCRFRQPGLTANTRTRTIDWQTQDLTVDLHRDDTADNNWKLQLGDYTTEAEAQAALNAALSVTVAEAANA